MKKIKLIITVCMILSFVIVSGQTTETKTEKKEMVSKKFAYTKDGTEYPYRVTVFKHTSSPLKLKDSEKEMVNQDIEKTAQYVKKMIYVDQDLDGYDRYIVMKYIKEKDDSFELKSTDRGFMVVVDDKNFEYIFGEGIYFVNNADKDFFIIDEFSAI